MTRGEDSTSEAVAIAASFRQQAQHYHDLAARTGHPTMHSSRAEFIEGLEIEERMGLLLIRAVDLGILSNVPGLVELVRWYRDPDQPHPIFPEFTSLPRVPTNVFAAGIELLAKQYPEALGPSIHIKEAFSSDPAEAADFRSKNWRSWNRFIEDGCRLFADLIESSASEHRTGAPSGECSHSPDFTSVVWYGVQHRFTPGQQARAVEILWEAFDSRCPTVGEQTIRDRIGSSDDTFRLFKVFNRRGQKHPAWETMIHRAGKGVFELRSPSDSPENPVS